MGKPLHEIRIVLSHNLYLPRSQSNLNCSAKCLTRQFDCYNEENGEITRESQNPQDDNEIC